MKNSIITTKTILDKIVARKIEDNQARYAGQLSLPQRTDKPRDMTAALRAAEPPGFAIIAEIKKASPSKGLIRPDFDPVSIAQAYRENHARAISVLTEEHFFKGSMDYLREVRKTVSLPVMCKDFIVDERQIDEAYAAGADAALLIARILEDGLFKSLYDKIRSLGMTALIEVHDRKDLERTLVLGPRLVGINNRDLATFETRIETTLDLLPLIPESVTVVSESGLKSHSDLERLASAGVSAFLIGEDLMRRDDVGARLGELRLGTN